MKQKFLCMILIHTSGHILSSYLSKYSEETQSLNTKLSSLTYDENLMRKLSTHVFINLRSYGEFKMWDFMGKLLTWISFVSVFINSFFILILPKTRYINDIFILFYSDKYLQQEKFIIFSWSLTNSHFGNFKKSFRTQFIGKHILELYLLHLDKRVWDYLQHELSPSPLPRTEHLFKKEKEKSS